MKNKELLPCPFCGSEAEFYRSVEEINGIYCDCVFVRCKRCRAKSETIYYDKTLHPNDKEYGVVKVAWNTRTNTIPVGNGQDYEVTHNDR